MRNRRDIRARIAMWHELYHEHDHHDHPEHEHGHGRGRGHHRGRGRGRWDEATKAERIERLEEHRRDVEEYLADLSDKIRRLQEDDVRPQPADDLRASTEPS